jgi:hypothetical protein
VIAVRKVNSITWIGAPVAAIIGDTTQYTVRTSRSGANVDPDITWSLTSGNGTYCTVDEQGLVTALDITSDTDSQRPPHCACCLSVLLTVSGVVVVVVASLSLFSPLATPCVLRAETNADANYVPTANSLSVPARYNNTGRW